MAKTYKITVTDTATYYIKAKKIDDAIDLAVERFDEREPNVFAEEFDGKAEYEIK